MAQWPNGPMAQWPNGPMALLLSGRGMAQELDGLGMAWRFNELGIARRNSLLCSGWPYNLNVLGMAQWVNVLGMAQDGPTGRWAQDYLTGLWWPNTNKLTNVSTVSTQASDDVCCFVAKKKTKISWEARTMAPSHVGTTITWHLLRENCTSPSLLVWERGSDHKEKGRGERSSHNTDPYSHQSSSIAPRPA